MSSPALFLWLLVAAAVLVSLYVVWPLLRRGTPSDAATAGHIGDDGASLNRDIIRERRQRLDEELAALPKDSPEREALVREFATAALADLAPEGHGPGHATLEEQGIPGDTPVGMAAQQRPGMTRLRQLLAVVFATLLVALPLAFYRTTGMPEAVVPGFDQQALKLNPGNGKALALAGAHEMNHGNARAALGYWEPLLAQLKPGTPQYQQVQQYIDAARQQADGTGAGPRANPGAGNGTSAAPAGETAGRGTSVPPTNEAAGKP